MNTTASHSKADIPAAIVNTLQLTRFNRFGFIGVYPDFVESQATHWSNPQGHLFA
jgi:hypothetical protein